MHQAKIEIIRLTRQQMLENVVEYFLMEQRQPGFKPNGGGCCYYAAPTHPDARASKCAIGCQFTDKQAAIIEDAFSNGATVTDIFNSDAEDDGQEEARNLVLNAIEREDQDFASRLQLAHDGPAQKYFGPEDGPHFRLALWQELMWVAVEFGLVLRPVTEKSGF